MEALLQRQDSFSIETKNDTTRTLAAEMVYLRHNWQKEDLPYDWRYLDGIGFHTRTHVDMLYASIDGVIDHAARREKVREWISQTEQDVKGFNLEYLAEGLTFPIYYQQEIINGEKKIVAPLYANKPMVDLTSADERNGVVKDTLAKKVEPYLLSAQDGSIAVMTSPSGWSGLHMENGEAIIYPDSQTYIWQKRGKEVVGFTVRTDFSLAEHKAFLQSYFGINLAPDATITDYVAAVGFLNANEYPGIDITQVVDSMRDTRFAMTQGSLSAYKDRMWQEVYRDLHNRDALWQFDTIAENLFSEFVEYIEPGNWTRREAEEALAVTILRMSRYLRGDKILKKEGISKDDSMGIYQEQVSYGAVLHDARELEGCAGGGSSTNGPFGNTFRELLLSITPRLAVSAGELIQQDTPLKEDSHFTCPKCPYKASGPIGNQCPGCGLTKEQFAEEGGEIC